MSREVRMVPPGWQHPIKFRKGYGDYTEYRFVPLLDGDVAKKQAEWDDGKAHWDAGEVRDTKGGWRRRDAGVEMDANMSFEEWKGARPEALDYMPVFPAGTATWFMMYETCSEGTPISPAFATREELARWLADFGASASGSMTATYTQWLAMCNEGWAPTSVIAGGAMISGVWWIGKTPVAGTFSLMARALFYVCKAIGPGANPGIFQVRTDEVELFLAAGFELCPGYDSARWRFIGMRKVAPVKDWWAWYDAAREWAEE